VHLSAELRGELAAVARSQTVSAAKAWEARVLLLADEDHPDGQRPDTYIAAAVGLSEKQVQTIRQRFSRAGSTGRFTFAGAGRWNRPYATPSAASTRAGVSLGPGPIRMRRGGTTEGMDMLSQRFVRIGIGAEYSDNRGCGGTVRASGCETVIAQNWFTRRLR
jgi:hypothetical protein